MTAAKIYILTIMLCAVGQPQCVMPQVISEHETHYDCVKNGMGDGYEILFGSDLTKQQSLDKVNLDLFDVDFNTLMDNKQFGSALSTVKDLENPKDWLV